MLVKSKIKSVFLKSISEIRDKGRASYFMLVDEKGNVKKEFENENSANNFMNTMSNTR